MNENLIRLQKEVDLSKAGIAKLAENAFESAGLPRATKDYCIAKLKAYAGQAIIISSSWVRELQPWAESRRSSCFSARMTVQNKKLKGKYLMEWYHHSMTTATAQAFANIAFTIYSEEKLD